MNDYRFFLAIISILGAAELIKKGQEAGMAVYWAFVAGYITSVIVTEIRKRIGK